MERRTLTREQALELLQPMIGQDLRELAAQLGITVFKNGKPNKGWAGHTIERALGFNLNSSQAPDGETWELKVVPLRRRKKGFMPKETMAITMINAKDVLATPFEHSHLFAKLRHLVICGREFMDRRESSSPLVSVGTFDLKDQRLLNQVKADYELVQETLRTKGFNALTGKMGILVQPRTKGAGHGSESRAFYARKEFLLRILGLQAL